MTTTPTLRDAAQAVVQMHLDNVEHEVHPCDVDNDNIKARHVPKEVQALRAALAAPADAQVDKLVDKSPDLQGSVVDKTANLQDSASADALAEPMTPFGYWHQGATEEESDFFKHDDMGNVACEKCITLYAAPPAAQLQRAVARAIEECAAICDELETHYTDYASTALLNGDVALSNAASGEPRACRAIAAAIRAKGKQ